MKEITVTLKESTVDPNEAMPETRIRVSDRTGAITHGKTISGIVIHLDETRYKANRDLRIIKIRTDVGIDFEILSYEREKQ